MVKHLNTRFIFIYIIIILLLLLSGCSKSIFGRTQHEKQVIINVQKVAKTIHLGDRFNSRKNVVVTSQEGKKLTLNKLAISGHVDPNKTGAYKLTYTYKFKGNSTSVSKVIHVIYERKEKIAYKTQTIEKKSMLRGNYVVHQKGENGSMLVRYQAKRKNGEIVLGKIHLQKVMKQSRSKIVYTGTKIPESYRMNVAVVSQLPELPAGCEITAVTMMLRYKGADVTKKGLAKEMPRATNGDPDTGFVGSPYSKSGATIYPPALMKLVKKYAGSAVNLTGASTDKLKDFISNNHPVVIWGTYDGFFYHALTLTGYSESGFYYNDPWTGTKRWMNNEQMMIHWNALERRALSY
ncbi:C39 family peptidase [Sporolactobacillus shoreicorticis]|uniref:C39 family peptidase n=1 Tax=Sporolactobacillus shoreicorticis TaxID=1923877 RepID=A0ABW5S9F6_9BACL|nr:C39 family peptidase [Sporolactobacillus shoreicorticis]MCO7125652.1 C39 family peptidase [Sporolactobacillus shoreicorticis]